MNGELPRGAWFWTMAALGWAGIAFGAYGLVANHVDLTDLAPWFFGGAILHDLVLAPVALGIAWLLTRVLPARFGVPLKVGLAVSALLVAFAWPLVQGYGRSRSVPSALPLDYGHNLRVALAIVWLCVGIWMLAAISFLRRGRV